MRNRKYEIIYADPPWSYGDKMRGHSFSLDHEYETQSKGWIKGNYPGSPGVIGSRPQATRDRFSYWGYAESI